MNRKIPLVFILFLSFLLRFWRLGDVPYGLSLEEVKFGIYLNSFLGNWILNAFLVRLTFFIIGLSSIFLFYYLTKRVFKNAKLSFIATALLTITPWHLMESRILSPGIVLFTLTLFLLFLLGDKIRKDSGKFTKYFLVASLFVFLGSLLVIPNEVRLKVNEQRHIVREQNGLITKIFSNKFIENYRFREKIIFEHLDFGGLFFKGHPRQRAGVEETQKLYIAFLPLVLLGVLGMRKRFFKFWLSFGIFYLAILSLFSLRGASFSLPLFIPIIFMTSYGLHWVLKKRLKYVATIFSLLLSIEAVVFGLSYFNGFEEGQFSPRRPVYKSLVPQVLQLTDGKEKVKVSQRLGNPDVFFQFYSKGKGLNNFELTSSNFKEDYDTSALYIDILPDDASPAEPLYKENDKWPNEIDVKYEVYETRKRQTVVIFEAKNDQK